MNARRLLVLSGGHPYDAEPFADLLASFTGWTVTHLLHPEAETAVAEGAANDADAILFYDMPGYRFEGGKAATRPPSFTFRRAITGYFARGGGAVAMHHAIAGWAEWPEWADMLGGRFLYEPGEANGEAHLDSGYRHEIRYDAVVLDPGARVRFSRNVFHGLAPAAFAELDERARATLARDNWFVAAAEPGRSR